MYINDVNILYYVVIGIIGLVVGQFVDWCNKRLPENKKIFSKIAIKDQKKGVDLNTIIKLNRLENYISNYL